MRLGEAVNVYNLALNEIAALGFRINYETEEDFSEWCAVRGDTQVYAFTPLSLLALCLIADKHGADWQTAPQQPLYDQILSEEK